MTEPLLILDQLTFAYAGTSSPAVGAVSLTVSAGEWVGLAGPNGAGKTTLLRLISGILLPQSGRIRVAGHDPADDAQLPLLRRRLGMVQANAGMQIVANTVEEDVAFGLANLGVSSAVMRDRVAAVLERLAITQLARRLPHTLSGGEEQLVALAGVLVLEPRVLVLDEATAHLDAAAAQRVREAVAEWRARTGGAVVWISHDVEELAGLARVVGVAGGAVVFDGAPGALWQNGPVRRKLQLALPAMPALLAAMAEAGNNRMSANAVAAGASAVTAAAAVAAACRRIVAGGKKVSGEPAAPAPPAGAVLAVAGLSVAFRSGRERRIILRDAGVTIAPGLTLVVGASGSGKTTLLNVLFGFVRPDAGSYRYRGVELLGRGSDLWHDLRRRLGYLFQFPERQLFAATVREELAAGLVWRGMLPAHAQLRVEEWVRDGQYLPAAWLDRNPFTLSQGEQRRVAVASVLILEPEILLCDEPLAGLDGAQAARLTELLRRFIDGGGTVVAATHQLAELWPLATALAVLTDGGIRCLPPGGSQRLLGEVLRAARVNLPPVCALLGLAAAELGSDDAPALADPAGAARWLLRTAAASA